MTGGVTDAEMSNSMGAGAELDMHVKLRLDKGSQLLMDREGEASNVAHVRFASPRSFEPLENIPIRLEWSCKINPSVPTSNRIMNTRLQTGSDDVGTSYVSSSNDLHLLRTLSRTKRVGSVCLVGTFLAPIKTRQT
jgi:hypothetical protein